MCLQRDYGQLVSLLAISQPGGAIIADPWMHIVSSEGGGFERLVGCRLIPIETNGVLAGGMVRERLLECCPPTTRTHTVVA